MAFRGKKVRLALIGCGDIAELHVKRILDSRSTELAAVMDVNRAAADRVGHQFNVPATASYESVLQDSGIDAVLISVPHYLHAPLALQAAEAGKHILCDKPIATTLADAERMIAACDKAGVTLSLLFTMRTSGLAGYARELIAKNVIGDITMVNFRGCGVKRDSYWSGGYTNAVSTDWRGNKKKSGGGFMMMNMTHMFDLVRYVTGLEAVSVKAEVATLATSVEVEDVGAAVFKYGNGAIGSYSGGTIMTGTKSSEREPVYIYGTHGQIRLHDGIFRQPLQVFTSRKIRGLRQNTWHEISGWEFRKDNLNIIEEFSRRLLSGDAPFASGHDGLAALEAVLGMYASSRTGRTVTMKHSAKK